METTQDLEKRLGATMRELRISREIDQVTLATNADISPTSLRNLEQGRGSSLATLLSVLRCLDRLDVLDALDEMQGGPTPLELLREHNNRPARPRRAPRRSQNKPILSADPIQVAHG